VIASLKMPAAGDSEVAGARRSRAIRLPMRSLFPGVLENEELLAPAASDRAMVGQR